MDFKFFQPDYTDPKMCWDWLKFGLNSSAYQMLHDKYNTYKIPIQDPVTFHLDLNEISKAASSLEDLHARLAQRSQERQTEIRRCWKSTGILLVTDRNWESNRFEMLDQLCHMTTGPSIQAIIDFMWSHIPSNSQKAQELKKYYLRDPGGNKAAATRAEQRERQKRNRRQFENGDTDDAEPTRPLCKHPRLMCEEKLTIDPKTDSTVDNTESSTSAAIRSSARKRSRCVNTPPVSPQPKKQKRDEHEVSNHGNGTTEETDQSQSYSGSESQPGSQDKESRPQRKGKPLYKPYNERKERNEHASEIWREPHDQHGQKEYAEKRDALVSKQRPDHSHPPSPPMTDDSSDTSFTADGPTDLPDTNEVVDGEAEYVNEI